MKRPILLAALLVSATLFTRSGASLVDSQSRLAKVSVLRLNREVKWDSRATPRRLVLIALEDCLLSIDGKSNRLEAGDYKEVDRGSNLTIDSTGSRPTQLVLIEVLSASQPLTIGSTTLASHEQLEDASDRNPTLLVAVSSLRLNDVRHLAKEDEPWKSDHLPTIKLQKGQAVWLKRGIHRLHNDRETVARFVTIEW